MTKDDIEALKWFRKAAEQGNANAQMVLGARYLKGDGVVKDYVEACKWLNLSAAQGNENAKRLLNDAENLFMTRDQIAEAQQLAREFKPRKTPESGSSVSGNNIANSQPSATGTGRLHHARWMLFDYQQPCC